MKFLTGLALLLALVALAAAMVLPDAEEDQHEDRNPLLRLPRAVRSGCANRACDFGCRANHGHPGGWCTNRGICQCDPIPDEMKYG